jgi:hypothetical protein
MIRRTAAAALFVVGVVTVASAQTPATPATLKNATHEISVSAGDTVYTGKVALKIAGGKVTGDMLITSPTEITGKVAGTSKDGGMVLEFPFHMTENMCTGSVKMNIKMPAAPGPATGTMEAKGCGDDPNAVQPGTVELKPIAAKTAK